MPGIDLYRKLIDENHCEQVYQSFLERFPQFLPREFVLNHGIHLGIILRKLRLSDDYVTDFAFLTKSSVSWNCVLIEFEKPQSKFFSKSHNTLHRDFLSGINQIDSWRAWFENPANRNGFISSTLEPLMGHMGTNPVSIKYVLVMGRRQEFENNADRIRLIKSKERDDFHIRSYDSLAENLEERQKTYICSKNNTSFKILSENFAGDSIFSWLKPEQLQISQELKTDILRNKDKWRTLKKINKFHLEEVLDQIQVI